RATGLIKKLLAEPTTARTGGGTRENARHLAQDFLDEIVTRYEGSRLGRQELDGEMLEVLEGAWFPSFDPKRHVSESAEWDPALPVRLAVDCGVSFHTGAVFFQARDVDRYRRRVTVFGDFYSAGSYSEANAEAIRARAAELCGGRVDL